MSGLCAFFHLSLLLVTTDFTAGQDEGSPDHSSSAETKTGKVPIPRGAVLDAAV